MLDTRVMLSKKRTILPWMMRRRTANMILVGMTTCNKWLISLSNEWFKSTWKKSITWMMNWIAAIGNRRISITRAPLCHSYRSTSKAPRNKTSRKSRILWTIQSPAKFSRREEIQTMEDKVSNSIWRSIREPNTWETPQAEGSTSSGKVWSNSSPKSTSWKRVKCPARSKIARGIP